MDLFFNAPVFLALLIYTFYILEKYKPNFIVSVSLIAGNFSPFFLNDFLFPADYFSDQFRYLKCAIEIRENFECNDVKERGASVSIIPSGLEFSSYFFSFFPAPIISSLLSISLINRFFFTSLIHYLLKSKKNYDVVAVIISIMPSAIFYSAIALRDNLIFIFLILFILFIFERKFILSMLAILIMIPVKLPLALAMIFLQMFFMTAPLQSKNLKIYTFIWLFFIFFGLNYLISYYSEIFFPLFNKYQNAMASDAGVMLPVPISDLMSLYYQVPSSILSFFYSPSFFEVSNIFQILAFIENNIFLIIFLYLFYQSEYKHHPMLLITLIILLAIGTIFALIVFSDGSLTRYIYPIKVAMLVSILAMQSNFKTNKY